MTETPETYHIERSVFEKPNPKPGKSFSFSKTAGKPNVFLIGAQKCGSASLLTHLSNHPEIHTPKNKEVGFFCDQNIYSKGESWYRKFFDNRIPVNVDGSASYFDSKQAAERVKAYNPAAKIILILRNPVDRAYSQYNAAFRLGFEKQSFEDALRLENDRIRYGERMVSEHGHNYCFQRLGYKTRGCYADYLPVWTNLFDSERMLILNGEDLFKEPHEVMRSVYGFVGVNYLQPQSDVWENKQRYSDEINPSVRSQMEAYYEPYNQRLFSLIGKKFEW